MLWSDYHDVLWNLCLTTAGREWQISVSYWPMNDSTVVALYDVVANGSDSHASHLTPWSIHGIQFRHGLLWTLSYASNSDKKTGSHF
jgi:hypothetical protein